MYSDYLYGELARTRQNERLNEANAARLLKKATAEGAETKHRFLLASGDLLIAFGQKLKGRYEPRIVSPPSSISARSRP